MENKQENTNKKIKSDKLDFLKTISDIENLSRKEILTYILKLHKFIRRQQRKLSKYKSKFRKSLKLSVKSEIKSEGNKTIGEDKAEASSNGKDAEEKKPKTFLEEIREAAESAQNDNGFVYEPTSGLYFDQKTGYYYNAEHGLYYDGNSGCYYNYDQETNEFKFHSQVAVPSNQTEKRSQVDDPNNYVNSLLNQFSQLNLRNHMLYNALEITYDDDDIADVLYNERFENDDQKRKKFRGDKKIYEKRRKNKRNKIKNERKKYKKDDFEDGEISSSSKESEDDFIWVESKSLDRNQTEFEDIAKRYPPSLRIIVQETTAPKLKIGELFIITFNGGTLGREGDHDVLIPDLNVSKFHLKFNYDEEKNVYRCIDLGSRNGTILNGTRMSNAKQESEPFDLVHGSIIQLNQTKLLCHVHNGNSTCGHCEPGLLIEHKSTENIVHLTHKEQLKKLQKRYGLENEKYVEMVKKSDKNYKDRAADRRDLVGSSNDCEKTQAASVETAISSDNKGFKMLSKLGWNKGEGLGKPNNSGLTEPISVKSNDGTKGLGSTEIKGEILKIHGKNQEKWRKAQERFKDLQKSNIFSSSDECSD